MTTGNELRIRDESSCLCYNKNGDGQSAPFCGLLKTLDRVFEDNSIEAPREPTTLSYVLYGVDTSIKLSTSDLAHHLNDEKNAGLKYTCTKISIYGADEVKVMELSRGKGETPWWLNCLIAVTGEIIGIIHTLWKSGMIIIPGNCRYLQARIDEYDKVIQGWLEKKQAEMERRMRKFNSELISSSLA